MKENRRKHIDVAMQCPRGKANVGEKEGRRLRRMNAQIAHAGYSVGRIPVTGGSNLIVYAVTVVCQRF